MKSHLCLVILTLALGPLASFAAEETPTEKTQDTPVPMLSNDGPLVEIQYPADLLTGDYKDRRPNRGWMFGLDYQAFRPTNYISTLDNLGYGNMFGSSPVQLFELQVAYKSNFEAGGFTVGFGGGAGQVTGSDSTGADRTLALTKLAVSGSYIMDTLFPQPYVAPYVQAQLYRFSVKESNPTTSFSADTQPGISYTAGILLQLDGLDRDTATRTTLDWGLQNTYLDVFMTKYMSSSGTNDPDFENNWDYGAGLRMEF
jgi:hypothetical protein